jgi:hypothetical protein
MHVSSLNPLETRIGDFALVDLGLYGVMSGLRQSDRELKNSGNDSLSALSFHKQDCALLHVF